ncbi:MAG: MFS transporter [Spirochaetia bacterium]
MIQQKTKPVYPLLSGMFFLQFFIFGTTIPIITLYMRSYLGFTGSQIGLILALTSLSAFITPVLWAFVVDRIVRAEVLLGASHFVGGLCMFLLYFQEGFLPFLVIYVLYNLFLGPTVALNNSISFSHLFPNGADNFGKVRMWGTIGWITVAWGFGYFWLKMPIGGAVDAKLSQALILAGAASMVMAFYSLFILPKRKLTENTVKPKILPESALKILVRKDILLLLVFTFLAGILDRFYYFGSSPFMADLGLAESEIMPFLSLGQVPELFGLYLLGLLIARIGFKGVFLLGTALQLFRFLIFALELPLPLVGLGISFHGLTFAFIIAAMSIYVDTYCDESSRGGVHQLFNIANFGFAKLLGNLFCGWVADAFAVNGNINFPVFWSVANSISIVLFILIFFLFSRKLQAL